MSRMILVLIIGWLLGIGTALVTPTLVYERQRIVRGVTDRGTREALRGHVDNGWYVTREDSQSITLERPRLRFS